jgi:hypothetical protein
VSAMNKTFAFTLVAAFGLGGAVGAFALLTKSAGDGGSALSALRPVWTETQWPFPMDQWGRGRAFRCKPADCGTDVNIYLRGYRIGAGGKRGERSAATARSGAHATAVVTFDGRAVFRAASSDRTPTADAEGSASRCPAPAGIGRAVPSSSADRSTAEHLPQLLIGCESRAYRRPGPDVF